MSLRTRDEAQGKGYDSGQWMYQKDSVRVSVRVWFQTQAHNTFQEHHEEAYGWGTVGSLGVFI